ncbi:MAG: hypothetical protein H6Q72_4786 [Firmicutes bacterium]|nr:hypothetical protein [Bacillota bacterium]
MNVPASAKYAIIREMTQQDNNLLKGCHGDGVADNIFILFKQHSY